MSINELQDEVIAEFSDFDDWMDRYQLLIDLGNEQEPLDEKYKTEQNLIEAYGNMLHSDGFISVSVISRRKICRPRMNR